MSKILVHPTLGRTLSRPEITSRAKAKRNGHLPVDPFTVQPFPTDGMCQLCERRPAKCLDHDHETGVFRGWLCTRCNVALGVFGDNEAGIWKVIAYLRRRFKPQTLVA